MKPARGQLVFARMSPPVARLIGRIQCEQMLNERGERPRLTKPKSKVTVYPNPKPKPGPLNPKPCRVLPKPLTSRTWLNHKS